MKYLAEAQVAVLGSAFVLGLGTVCTAAIVLGTSQNGDRPEWVSPALGMIPLAVALLSWAAALGVYVVAYLLARMFGDNSWIVSVRTDVFLIWAFVIWGTIANICMTVAVGLSVDSHAATGMLPCDRAGIALVVFTWVLIVLLFAWISLEIAYVKVEYGRIAAVWSQSLRSLVPSRVRRGGKVNLHEPHIESKRRSERPLPPLPPIKGSPPATPVNDPNDPRPNRPPPALLSPLTPTGRELTREAARQERHERHRERRERRERRLQRAIEHELEQERERARQNKKAEEMGEGHQHGPSCENCPTCGSCSLYWSPVHAGASSPIHKELTRGRSPVYQEVEKPAPAATKPPKAPLPKVPPRIPSPPEELEGFVLSQSFSSSVLPAFSDDRHSWSRSVEGAIARASTTVAQLEQAAASLHPSTAIRRDPEVDNDRLSRSTMATARIAPSIDERLSRSTLAVPERLSHQTGFSHHTGRG